MTELDSREKILRAAIAVFADKGKYGAKMEEIAVKAGVNKAMVYYYYSTKENLYQEILRYVISQNLSRIYKRVDQIITESAAPIDTLKLIVAVYFDVFSSEKTYTKLVLDAISSEPQEFEQILRRIKFDLNLDIPGKFLSFLEKGMAQHIFRRVEPKQLLLSIVAMSMFYFFGKPALKVFLDLQIEDEQIFLKERQEAIIDLMLFGIIETEWRDA
jgi:AcrR family transcriptional regulator